MLKHGRNEVCHCGSGKKYKRCCGQNNNIIELNPNTITKSEADKIRRGLQQFVLSKKQLVDKAIVDIANKIEINIDSVINELFEFTMDLIVFDYPVKDEMTLFDLYLKDKQREIKDRVLRIIHSWRDSYLSVYEVKDFYEDEGLILIDLLTKEEKLVKIYGLNGDANKKDLHIGRLLPVESWNEYLNGCIILPSQNKEALINEIKYTRRNKEIFGEKYNNWKEFLKNEGDVFIEVLLDEIVDETMIPLNEDYYDEELHIRQFLSMPHRLLDGMSPLQASYNPKMSKKLKKFIDKIEKGEIDKELQAIDISNHIDIINSLLYGENSILTDIESVPFDNETYKNEALLFIKNCKGKIFLYDIEKTIDLWYLYTSDMKPIIRKSGSWASVLEYIMLDEAWCQYQPTQKEIAKKYGVSHSTVSSNSQMMIQFMYRVMYSYEEEQNQPELLRAPANIINRPKTEKSMLDISEILQNQDFHSIEDANSFMNSILNNGMLEQNKSNLSKKDEAKELIYSAWDSNSKREKIRLANKALKLDENCIDAYNILAEFETNTLEEKIQLFKKALSISERVLGKSYFQENKGHFWGLLETRPYMRAKMGLAQCLIEEGRKEEAINNFYDMLSLNPNDNQGVRYLLAPYLMENGRFADAIGIMNEYDEESSDWLFNKALYTFKSKGANKRAENLLKKAIENNKYVADYLLQIKPIPKILPDNISHGSKEEAINYASYAKKAWEKTWGAIAWLKHVNNN
ncbi:SEC-C metal-binding domain-containing protein [Alkaliphilus peptidifermentans]|uniref:SEC-C motif-containing protein n=1 Tax=Alkaliphilus peptidifermentans DSM 18978 TaxID=1120976 RepID=A0A1G5AEF7_9FIRM|nr:SEC-C metal-binding domain-containing protein [Alkaliphilus peptidifermentans]SCX76272.1 SEC-C motif-containing protein [Alkaliphilus peptidifermentans DSM 18978]